MGPLMMNRLGSELLQQVTTPKTKQKIHLFGKVKTGTKCTITKFKIWSQAKQHVQLTCLSAFLVYSSDF